MTAEQQKPKRNPFSSLLMVLAFAWVCAGSVPLLAQPFDVVKGNQGVIRINKAPEQITTDDVRHAYNLPWLDSSAAKSGSQGNAGLWTAAQVGLRAGDSPTIGMANAAALTDALGDERCTGLKLDQLYRIDVRKRITIPRNFVIDGEVEGKAVGGFKTRDALFHTEHSLNLRRVRTLTTNGRQYFTYQINCRRGIDQLQVVGCVFEDVNNHGGRMIRLYCDDTCPHDGQWMAADTNCIRHLYVEGCHSHGNEIISSSGIRVVGSCRIIGNTFDDIEGSHAVSLATDNNSRYANLMAYMSCPFYIVGNTFRGVSHIFRKRRGYYYYCAALVENSALYMLHNTISNIVAGETRYTRADGKRVEGRPAVYDLYYSGQQLYYANNTVRNVVRLTYNREDTGIIKAKSAGLGGIGVYRHRHRPLVRYFKNNHYSIDRGDIKRLWDCRTYPTTGGDYADEIAYDKALVLDDVLTVNLCDYVDAIPVRDFTFSGNTISVPGGNIGGIIASNQWRATHFTCDNNRFIARKISSRQYKSRRNTKNSEWLFPIRLDDYWGATSVSMTGNSFRTGHAAIHFFLSKYGKNREGRAKTTAYRGNTCLPGSEIRIARLCTDGWSLADY